MLSRAPAADRRATSTLDLRRPPSAGAVRDRSEPARAGAAQPRRQRPRRDARRRAARPSRPPRRRPTGAGERAADRRATPASGMDATHARACFEPFFTTKGRARAPASAWPRCTASSTRPAAHITSTPSPGTGATFQVSLPRGGPTGAEHRSRVGAPVASAPAATTMLLVEDDEDGARARRSVLTDAGYRVLAAAAGASRRSRWHGSRLEPAACSSPTW